MVIEKREQVFVSSTYIDLEEERRAVIQTLLEADCIPAGMELFPASNSHKFDLIKNVIDGCDYYIVIIGGRYGSVDEEEQLSYTEMEYDYAVSQGTPVMAFLHGNPGSIPVEKSDIEPELRDKLNAFRAKAEDRMVKYWKDPSEIEGLVALSLIQIRKEYPAVGWVRGDKALTPEIEQELGELRLQVKELTAELNEEKRQHSLGINTDELSQGDEKASLGCELVFLWQEDMDEGKDNWNSRVRGRWDVEISWNEIFKHLGPLLMDEATERQLQERLSIICEAQAHTDLIDNHESFDADQRVAKIYKADITEMSFEDVLVQLRGLGYIEHGTKRRNPSNSHTYWKLTEKGLQRLLQLRTIRRTTQEPENVEE